MPRRSKQSASVSRARKQRHMEVGREALIALAGQSERARLMVDAPSFRSIPGRLVGVKRALACGGYPLGTVYLVHGPEGGGKTVLALSMIDAVIREGGIGLFVDVEQSAETKRWFVSLNFDMTRCIYIGRVEEDRIVKPLTYEAVVKEVDGFLNRYDDMRSKKLIPPTTPVVIVIDSVSNLAPEKFLAKLAKEGGKALRSGVGREQAMMNRGWMMELEARIGSSPVAVVVISHETDNGNLTGYGADYDVRGGRSLRYNAMMQLRSTFAGRVFDIVSSEGKPGSLVGKRHRVDVLKNKHAAAHQTATFYISNGYGLAPLGFDTVRETIHEALLQGRIDGPDPFASGFKLTLGSTVELDGKKFSLRAAYEKPEIVEMVSALRAELGGLAGGKVNST